MSKLDYKLILHRFRAVFWPDDLFASFVTDCQCTFLLISGSKTNQISQSIPSMIAKSCRRCSTPSDKINYVQNHVKMSEISLLTYPFHTTSVNQSQRSDYPTWSGNKNVAIFKMMNFPQFEAISEILKPSEENLRIRLTPSQGIDDTLHHTQSQRFPLQNKNVVMVHNLPFQISNTYIHTPLRL